MKSAIKPCVLVAIVLLISGCARTYQARHIETADFLDDYTVLKEGQGDEGLLTYWKKGVNWGAYKKVILEPVNIKKTPGAELSKMTHADGYRLTEILGFRLQEALKITFKPVNKPEVDTLYVQFSVTDVDTSAVLFDTFSSLYHPARVMHAVKQLTADTEFFVGKASIEGKVIDSSTGELLMVSVGVRADGKPLEVSNDEWADIEKAYKYWVFKLNYQLCMWQRRKGCQKPG